MRNLALLFVVAISWCNAASADDVPILRFSQVSSAGIYRGARPGTMGMEALAQLGIKTDLDLENNSAAIQTETHDANRLGIRLISKPMSGFWKPHDTEVNEILSIVADQNNYPIFIHCQHGQDRTGLIVGLVRVFEEGWTPTEAYAEMRSIGFHRELFFLNHYFEEKTGFDD